ncbi:MAG: 50S ribosomal protein L11 methyltransferase [Clostridia bacterium]|nr:50S ribosomal protein L11 methyltransferase [Clostridia bacterium]
MEFKEIVISTTTDGIDVVTGTLSLQGLQNFVIEDAADFREFLETNTPRWDYIDGELLAAKENCESKVKLYLAANAQGEEQLETVKEVLKGVRERDEAGLFGPLTLEVSEVREEDWAENWKQYFKPFPVGEKFLIKPSWETVEDAGGRTVLEIDPASSFGTGSHATTRLCIEYLEDIVGDGTRFLDLGCGSGILTMAARLLGAKDLCAVDVDDNAVEITKKNLARAHGAARTFVGDLTSDRELLRSLGAGYDVAAANIVADVLLALMPFFGTLVRKGGKAVLSGIISERRGEIEKAARDAGYRILSARDSEDWSALLLEI